MNKIEASASSLNAEETVIRRAVVSLGINDLVVLYYEIELTSRSAVRTGGKNLLNLPASVLSLSLLRQCTCGTCLGAVAA